MTLAEGTKLRIKVKLHGVSYSADSRESNAFSVQEERIQIVVQVLIPVQAAQRGPFGKLEGLWLLVSGFWLLATRLVSYKYRELLVYQCAS